jgi:hypothetical protein
MLRQQWGRTSEGGGGRRGVREGAVKMGVGDVVIRATPALSDVRKFGARNTGSEEVTTDPLLLQVLDVFYGYNL